MARVLLLGPCGPADPGGDAVHEAVRQSLCDHEILEVGHDPTARSASTSPSTSTSTSTSASTSTSTSTSTSASTVGGAHRVDGTPLRVAAAIRHADAVVVAGASAFGDCRSACGRSRSSSADTALLVAAAHIRKIPIALVGVGADEARGSARRALSRWAVPHADLLVLRDEESAAVLTDSGSASPYWIGADLAWSTLADRPRLRRPEDGPSITVTLSGRPTTIGGAGAPSPALAEVLDERSRANGRIVRLQPWRRTAGAFERDELSEVARRIGEAQVISAPRDLREAAAALAGSELVVTDEPHAIVAAAAAGRRVLAIAHGPHAAGLARRLDQVSVPPHASPAVLRGALDWALAHDPPRPQAVAAEIGSAERTLRLLRLLLDGGHLERPDELEALQLSDGGGRW